MKRIKLPKLTQDFGLSFRGDSAIKKVSVKVFMRTKGTLDLTTLTLWRSIVRTIDVTGT